MPPRRFLFARNPDSRRLRRSLGRPAPARLASHQWLWAFGLAFGGAFAHYCLTNALRVADAIVVIPLDFIRIPLIAFVGWMFYGERVDVLVFVGAGIIVSGIIWNLRAEMRRTDHGGT